MGLRWQGEGENEVGIDDNGRAIVAIDSRYFRPTEVDNLLGDASLAQRELGWRPKCDFHQLVCEMTREDLRQAEREDLVVRNGFSTVQRHE
jgi:GDPmannose 4,6-dehydratase